MSSRRCVVIGAGILGASVAARLASAGMRVTLLDRDQPGRATSRRSLAWLNSNDKAPRHYHDLNHPGLRAWARSHSAGVPPGEPGRVTGLEPGAVPRVRTAAGGVLEADEVVCCAGRWTPELAPIPLVPWRIPGSTAPGFVVRIGPVTPPGLVRLVHTPELALRPHPGRLLHLEAPDAAVDLHPPEP